MQAKQELLKTSPTDPTIDDIANKLSIPVREVACALDAISEPISLYDTVYGDEENMLVMDQIKDLSTEDTLIEQTSLKDALSNLDKREKQIIIMRYYYGKTQTEISNLIGISQAQVSRLEKNDIKTIKNIV